MVTTADALGALKRARDVSGHIVYSSASLCKGSVPLTELYIGLYRVNISEEENKNGNEVGELPTKINILPRNCVFIAR